MTPTTLLAHYDSAQLWPAAPSNDATFDMPQAYRDALAVFAPVWGTVYASTLNFFEGQGNVSLAHTCQPRLEPETVFGMKATPLVDASLDELFAALDWVAPGFEVVQSHMLDWKFKSADTVADGGLHARLLVGRKVPVGDVAANAAKLNAILAAASASLRKGGHVVESGRAANVLDGPLLALQHFLKELRACPGAPDLMPGDVVTTGTWTDAWPVLAGEQWQVDFSAPLSSLQVTFA